MQEDARETSVRFPRMSLDFKLPLPWVLSGAISVLWGLIGMWFKLSSVSDSVEEMKVAVKANNLTTVQYASEQTLIKYRLEKLEAKRENERPQR